MEKSLIIPNKLNVQSDAEICQVLGRRLQGYRLQQNRTVAELATQTGLNRNTILNAERGANPRLETVVRILRALDRLDALDAFLPPAALSPLQLLALRGKLRRRASRPRRRAPPRG
ncbi:MAG TPA: helix-turn-helix transcriptional regulator [Gemmatimonadales bacterium]|jgi:transcriptional regulator with XRE-family HTH domain|nr:helix-turn-helix transcriptional regulator [Gemmatimonadales bacterium]